MGIRAPTEDINEGPEESKKRRREVAAVLTLGFLFAILTWVEVALFGLSAKLPFIHSVFFFGLVNFNILIVLLLLFLVFRNVVKIFVERKGKFFGSSIRAKLVAAFVAFSTVPTLLMFVISVFYINSSFDKWFSIKVSSVLKSSLDVTNAYYSTAKKRNYHFADKIARNIAKNPHRAQSILLSSQDEYSLDLVEYYPSLFGERIVVGRSENDKSTPPPVNLELLTKGIVKGLDASTIHHFVGGNLVRAIVPVNSGGLRKGAVVVSAYVPLSLLTRMNDVASAYEEFRDINPIEYPLKSIYMILLVLMTLVILVCATWFGFYLAKHLSIPLFRLGEASRRIARGEYQKIEMRSGSEEINDLISSFNQMTSDLSRSQKEISAAHESLRVTLERLDEHSRYIEVVLSSISTGVISLDSNNRIITINRRAGDLLRVNPEQFVGYRLYEVFNHAQMGIFEDLMSAMNGLNATSVQKEVHFDIAGCLVPMQMNLSTLRDEGGIEVGKVLVFDDLSHVVNAQRAAAWTEVARRIAHEIKNPLTPIKLSAQRLQKRFGEGITDPAFASSTKMIIQQVDDLKALVNEFNNFARLPESRPTVGDLNSLCQEVVAFYQTAHANIGFELNADPLLRAFLFDRDQMRRVLNNLVDNAVAAVDGMSASLVQVSTTYDRLLGIVRLRVADNGVGLLREEQQRIFEPYFSTKSNGTGLGLAIVRRVVEDHNGFVRARSNYPQGTEMIVEIPFVEVQVSTRLRTENSPAVIVREGGVDEA